MRIIGAICGLLIATPVAAVSVAQIDTVDVLTSQQAEDAHAAIMQVLSSLEARVEALEAGTPVEPPEPPPIEPPPPGEGPLEVTGANFAECKAKLTRGGFCEMTIDAATAWRPRDEVPDYEYGAIGPRASWLAWNGWAFNWPKAWLGGGGHNDSNMIDVYEVDFIAGTIERIYTPPPLDVYWLSDKFPAEERVFIRRHRDYLPMSDHNYDGYLYDPSTGLILVYVSGFVSVGAERIPDMDMTREDVITDPKLGFGIYAFNPTDATIKNVNSKSWRKVSDWYSPYHKNYNSSEIHGGKMWVGDHYAHREMWWEGDNLVVDTDTEYRGSRSYNVSLFSDGETLYRLNRSELVKYDQDMNLLGTVPNWTDGANLAGDAIAKHGDSTIHWDGWRIVSTLSPEGKWRVCDFSKGVAARVPLDVFSKWNRIPGHDDLYVGWQDPGHHHNDPGPKGPVVYRHDDAMCQDLPDFTDVSIDSLLRDSDTVTLDADTAYLKGPTLVGSKTIDFNWATVGWPADNNKGFVVAKGGPHVIKNLSVTREGRAMVYGMLTPRITIDGFRSEHQQLGLLTSNDGGDIVLKNGVIRDGWGVTWGQQHNVYVGEIDSLTVENLQSYSHHYAGHLLKSRAEVNHINNSVFDGEDSRHSRILDFPCGGEIYIGNSTMRQSPNSDNDDLLSVAVESCRVPVSTVVLENTTWEANVPNTRFLSTKEIVNFECLGANEFVGVESPCA